MNHHKLSTVNITPLEKMRQTDPSDDQNSWSVVRIN